MLAKTLFLSLTLSTVLVAAPAHAQRMPIPVADLVDVPITLATTSQLTAAQVRAAIVAASLANQWDTLQADGNTIRLSYLKDLEHRSTVDVSYSATTYSIRYVSSEGLKYADAYALNIAAPLAESAKEWRINRTAKLPEAKFAVDRQAGVIHPAYEQAVYELSAAIRRHLKASAP